MRRVFRLALVLLLLTGAILPALAAPVAVPAPPATGPDSEKVLTLGMVLYADAKSQAAQIDPLVKYLGRRLGRTIELRLYTDYVTILNDIDHEGLDLAILSPLVYALCIDDASLTFLAMALEKDKPFYHAVLLARKDGPVLRLGDLKGRKVGLVDRFSASGYVFPAATLGRAGLVKDGTPLYEPVFLGSHEKALRALLDGRVDAAATFDTFFLYAKNQVGEARDLSLDSFRILRYMPERIPTDALVCRTALGKDVAGALLTALKEYPEVRSQAGSPLKDVLYQGFRFESRNAYEDVKKFLDGLEAGSAEGASAADVK